MSGGGTRLGKEISGTVVDAKGMKGSAEEDEDEEEVVEVELSGTLIT